MPAVLPPQSLCPGAALTLDDATLDGRALLVGLRHRVPDADLVGLVLREDDQAFLALGLLDQHVDLVATQEAEERLGFLIRVADGKQRGRIRVEHAASLARCPRCPLAVDDDV